MAMSAREGIQLDQRFSPPTLFIVIGAHLRTGRPTLTEFFTSLPKVEPWEKNKRGGFG